MEKQLHDARLRGLERMTELRKAAEPVLETGAVCELLSLSRETIRKKVARRQLLALPKGETGYSLPSSSRTATCSPGLPRS